MLKKIFGVIVILGLFVGSFFGVFYAVKYSNLQKDVLSKTEYIEEIERLEKELIQSEESYLKLNNEYVLIVAENKLNKQEVDSIRIELQEKETFIQNLQQTIQDKENRIVEIEIEKSNLLSQIEDMTEENEEAITVLNNKISQLETEKETLISEKQTLQVDYDNLIVEKNNLILDKETLQNRIEVNEVKIVDYERQILEFQNEITRLNNLLKSYEELMNETHVVTFYIGDEIYITKAVRHGKSVSDLDVPEETNSYVFNYWTLDNETEVDISTISITEDVTFYANYTPKFKVEFESVGLVVDTQYVVENSVASKIVDPYKQGYTFVGWTLDGENVIDIQNVSISENTKFIAKFSFVSVLGLASWQEVADVCEAGQAEEYFNVGDEVDITLTTGEVLTFVVLGFNHDDLSDGSGKASLSLGMKNLMEEKYSMNSTNTSYTGWKDSYMRKTTLANIYNTLPEDVKNVIKAVDKKSKIGKQWENDIPDTEFVADVSVVTSDKIWLFTEYEILGRGCSSDGTVQYSYYQNSNGVFAKSLSNGLGNGMTYWMRSASSYATKMFRVISTSGVYSSNSHSSASNKLGICFGFCI